MFSFFRKASAQPPSRISGLTYAIGDIHGRADLFGRMIDQIKADMPYFNERPTLVLLGDYIDRGPHSRQVIDQILHIRSAGWCDLVTLMGNHEQALLKFMEEPAFGATWCEHGGKDTLSSYGVEFPIKKSDAAGWTQARDALRARMSEPQVELLKEMDLVFVKDDYLFVHAGVKPGLAISQQTADTLLWIRKPFLAVDKACDYVVVHGHTPEKKPANTRWRIGLDTGAYATNQLTAVRLFQAERMIITIK